MRIRISPSLLLGLLACGAPPEPPQQPVAPIAEEASIDEIRRRLLAELRDPDTAEEEPDIPCGWIMPMDPTLHPLPPKEFVSSWVPTTASRPPAVVADAEEPGGSSHFALALTDPLSTFSVDVDTASYSFTRRSLQAGQWPPAGAVRIEEFVNHFDYDYAPPPLGGEHPFQIHVEAFPDPFRQPHYIMRVGVQAAELPSASRPPLHLTFLVDVSGSMSSDDRLPLAQQALRLLVGTLQDGDTASLVTYTDQTAELLPPTGMSNRRAIYDAIEGLDSHGSTAMSSGIDAAYDMAQRAFEDGAENRVIILSDGDSNIDTTRWEDVLAQIQDRARMGVTLYTIGFGADNDHDTLMEQLADNGDGNYYYIDSEEQVRRVSSEMADTFVTVARDVKVQLAFDPRSVHAHRLIGYENRGVADEDFHYDHADAGKVGSGHSATALYEVVLRENHSGTLATVHLRYRADQTDTEMVVPFPASAVHTAEASARRGTRIAYATATFAEILRDSFHTKEVSLEELAAFTERAARPGRDDEELISLMRTAQRLNPNSPLREYPGCWSVEPW